MRRCKVCGKSKDESEFYFAPKMHRRGECKECSLKLDRERRNRKLVERLTRLVEALKSYIVDGRLGANGKVGSRINSVENLLTGPIEINGNGESPIVIRVEGAHQKKDKLSKGKDKNIPSGKPLEIKIILSQ